MFYIMILNFLDYNNELLENGYNRGELINYSRANSTILKYTYTKNIKKVSIVAEFSNSSLNKVYKKTNTSYLILILIGLIVVVVMISKILKNFFEKEDEIPGDETEVKKDQEFDYIGKIKERITISEDFLSKKDLRKACSYLGKAIRVYVCSKKNIKGFINDRVAIEIIYKNNYEKKLIEILKFCREVVFKDQDANEGEIKEKITFAKSRII